MSAPYDRTRASTMLQAFVATLATSANEDDRPAAAPGSGPGSGTVQAGPDLGDPQVRWSVVVARRALDAVLGAVDADRAAWLAPRLGPAVERTVADLLLHLRRSAPGRPASAGARLTVDLNPQERDLITVLATDDVPFRRIVEGLRIVQSICTADLLDSADHRPVRERGLLLRGLTDAVSGFFDATVDSVVAQYMQDRERLISRRLTARRTLVEAILARTPVGEDEARRSLGVDLAGPHLALVAWTAALAGHRLLGRPADLEGAARRAADVLHCRSALSIPGEDGLWIWISKAEPFTAADLQALRTVRIAPDGVGLAVGEPGRGIEGFRRSHIAARDAARVARAVRTDRVGGRVVVYRDVGLVALLMADPERARWFVTEELGELGEPGPVLADLRRTVLSYLDAGWSLVGAAAALHVHRNTVVHRLRRAEEVLGRPLTERTLALHAALRLAQDAEPTEGSE